MAGERHATVLARIASDIPDGPLLERLCRGSLDVLGVGGAALILMSDLETGAIAATSDAKTVELEDLQFALGEGPCLEAFRTGSAVLLPNLADGDRDRWPMFADGAVGAGSLAVFALPLHVGAARLGVLYLHRDRAGGLHGEQLADAYAVADIATWILLDQRAGIERDALDESLDGSWTYRALVHQATGVLAARLHCSMLEALTRLRAQAFGSDTSIYDVAKDLLKKNGDET